MKRILTWLKAKAREWCAPDYDELSVQVVALATERCELHWELKKAWKTSRRHSPLFADAVDFEKEPAWLEEDAAAWNAFLRTPTGDKLKRKARHREQMHNRSAVLRTEGFENNCGRAAGFNGCATWMLDFLLSADLPLPTEDDTRPVSGADGLRERVTP